MTKEKKKQNENYHVLNKLSDCMNLSSKSEIYLSNNKSFLNTYVLFFLFINHKHKKGKMTKKKFKQVYMYFFNSNNSAAFFVLYDDKKK